jgi:hypothetical protein
MVPRLPAPEMGTSNGYATDLDADRQGGLGAGGSGALQANALSRE